MVPVTFSRHPWVSPLLITLLGVTLGLTDRSLNRAQVDFSLIGTFPDVPLSHPAYEAIEYLVQKGVVSGYPNGTFQPEQEINRAEFTKIVVGARFLPLDVEECLSSIPSSLLYTPTLLFPDVARHQWFAKYVCQAKMGGMIGGSPDGTFRPATPVNFVEAAKILAYGFELPLGTPPAESPWYRSYIEALANRSAIPLSISSLDKRITRSEMAEMVYRLHANMTDQPSLTFSQLASPHPPTSSSPPDRVSSSASPPSSSSRQFSSFSPTSVEYSQRIVTTSGGMTHIIDVITADLDKGVRALTVAINEQNCASECPVSPLADFALRIGGVAGINGTYFCPSDQLHCAGQRNSFVSFLFNLLSDTFLNEEQRSLSTAGGLFVFRPGNITFFQNPAAFSLDHRITGAIASWPVLIVGGKVVLDPLTLDEHQRTSAGTRGALGNKGNTLYLISAQNTTISDLALILQTMELENGINIDGDESSALFYRGTYKVGPGRPIPNALILAP